MNTEKNIRVVSLSVLTEIKTIIYKTNGIGFFCVCPLPREGSRRFNRSIEEYSTLVKLHHLKTYVALGLVGFSTVTHD